MRNDSTVFVGLDVHQKSIVAAYAVDAGEVQDLGQGGSLQRDLDRLCTQMLKGIARALRCTRRALAAMQCIVTTAKGFRCTVCAPSLIARKPRDRAKTDQRDARKLAQALRMHDLSAVHVPDAADKAFFGFGSSVERGASRLAKVKQRLKSFLLVHDVRYSGTANWSEAHRPSAARRAVQGRRRASR